MSIELLEEKDKIQALQIETGEMYLFEMNIEQKQVVMKNILETLNFIIENNLDVPGAFQRIHSLYITLYRDYFIFANKTEYETFSRITDLSELSKVRANVLLTITDYLNLFKETRDINHLKNTFLLNSLFRDLTKPAVI